MEKTISVDGHELKLKATASTPRVYRQAFGRDIFVDIKSLLAGLSADADVSVEYLNAFENIAYCLNAQAEGKELKRETLEKDMEEWLDQFETFSIYHIFPQIMDLWRLTNEQTVEPKNPLAQPSDQ
jgi:hypothetical protein